jgi:hypothetical protein
VVTSKICCMQAVKLDRCVVPILPFLPQMYTQALPSQAVSRYATYMCNGCEKLMASLTDVGT